MKRNKKCKICKGKGKVAGGNYVGLCLYCKGKGYRKSTYD